MPNVALALLIKKKKIRLLRIQWQATILELFSRANRVQRRVPLTLLTVMTDQIGMPSKGSFIRKQGLGKAMKLCCFSSCHSLYLGCPPFLSLHQKTSIHLSRPISIMISGKSLSFPTFRALLILECIMLCEHSEQSVLYIMSYLSSFPPVDSVLLEKNPVLVIFVSLGPDVVTQ